MHVYPKLLLKKIHNFIQKNFHSTNIKKCFVLQNIRMINLLFDELRLIALLRNISDYESKPKEDLIKAHSEPRQETKPKPETPKPETKPKQ